MCVLRIMYCVIDHISYLTPVTSLAGAVGGALPSGVCRALGDGIGTGAVILEVQLAPARLGRQRRARIAVGMALCRHRRRA